MGLELAKPQALAWVLLLVFALSLASAAWAQETASTSSAVGPVAASLALPRSGSMKIFAVTNEGQGLSADLTLEIVPGTGKVWTTITPLVGTTTQSAEKTALIAAKKYAKDWDHYDYKFSIASSAAMVEGPSAGAAMAYLTVALLQGREVPKDVSLTGTISEDGIVGSVGGVFEKSKAARDAGMKLFMIPSGEARRIEKLDSGVESINLVEYAKEKWGIYVIEVATIDDVLKYAYSDLTKLDIKELAGKEPPQFVPKPANPAEELAPMRDITKRHLQETKQLMVDARNALSSSLIDDISVIGRMVGSLNNAEKNLKTAEILLDKGYYYSSANFAFLARVNALLIKDIAENPSLLSDDATVFQLKLDLLKQDVVDLKKQLGEFMPRDRLEWLVSAQQRLGWAETTLNQLSTNQTVVVADSSGATPDKKSAVIDALYKYESARAWLVVAKEFFGVADQSTDKIEPLTDFTEEVKGLLVKAENGLSVFKGDEADDVKRRIDSAKEEVKRGWTLSALYNAASAQALIVGKTDVDQAPADKLDVLLQKRITDLQASIAQSKYKHIWANLYLDHARYYYEQAAYYRSLSHLNDATDSLKSGLSLMALADALFKTTEEVHQFYDKNAGTALGGTAPAAEKPAPAKVDQTGRYLLFFFVPTVLFVVLLVLLLKILKARKSGAKYSVYEEIKEVKQKLRELEDNLETGRVSQDEYLSESGRLSEEMRRLLRMREAKTEASFASDKFRADVLLFDMKAKELRRGLKQGAISAPDFTKLVNEYNSRVKQLYEALAEQESLSGADWKEKPSGQDKEPWQQAGESDDLAEVQRSVRKQVKAAPKKRWAASKK